MVKKKRVMKKSEILFSKGENVLEMPKERIMQNKNSRIFFMNFKKNISLLHGTILSIIIVCILFNILTKN